MRRGRRWGLMGGSSVSRDEGHATPPCVNKTGVARLRGQDLRPAAISATAEKLDGGELK